MGPVPALPPGGRLRVAFPSVLAPSALSAMPSPLCQGLSCSPKPAPRCWPGLGGQPKDPWHGRPPGPRRRPGWFRAVFVPLPAPLCAISVGPVVSACSVSLSRGAQAQRRVRGGGGLLRTPPAGEGVGPEAWVLLLLQLSRGGSRRLTGYHGPSPGGVPPGVPLPPLIPPLGRLAPGPCLSLLMMRKPGAPAQGPLPAPRGGR